MSIRVAMYWSAPWDGLKGLILRHCGKLNSTHAGKLRQPQQALLLVQCGCRSTRAAVLLVYCGSRTAATYLDVGAGHSTRATTFRLVYCGELVYCGKLVYWGELMYCGTYTVARQFTLGCRNQSAFIGSLYRNVIAIKKFVSIYKSSNINIFFCFYLF